jgi:hypothetical protein
MTSPDDYTRNIHSSTRLSSTIQLVCALPRQSSGPQKSHPSTSAAPRSMRRFTVPRPRCGKPISATLSRHLCHCCFPHHWVRLPRTFVTSFHEPGLLSHRHHQVRNFGEVTSLTHTICHVWIRCLAFCRVRLGVPAVYVLHVVKRNFDNKSSPHEHIERGSQNSEIRFTVTSRLSHLLFAYTTPPIVPGVSKHSTSVVNEARLAPLDTSADALGKRKYLSRSVPLAFSLRHSTNKLLRSSIGDGFAL